MFFMLVNGFVSAYTFIIFVYVLMSWIPQQTGWIADINNALAKLCDPYLNLFKKFIPPIGGMVDISPIAAVLVLQLIPTVLRMLIG